MSDDTLEQTQPLQEAEPEADADSSQEDEAPAIPVKNPAEALAVLEAVLFASEEILTAARLKAILPGEPDAREIRRMVDTVNANLQAQRHPFEIAEIAGGYQFRTVSYYSPWVRKLLKEKAAKRLSIQALECLAIISYRQPITKAEIESVRGVLSDGAMKTLLERRMVTIVGRSEKAGRPLLYGTTKEYLAYFGLKGLTDLPRMEEFEALAREKMGDIAEELDKMQSDRVAAQAVEAANAEDGVPVIEKLAGSQTSEDDAEAELIAAAAAQESPVAVEPELLDAPTDDAPDAGGSAPEDVPT